MIRVSIARMTTQAQTQRRRVAFLHTAAPAIPPLAKFYSEHAPELEITNLLDDAIIRALGAGRHDEAEHRLRALMQIACGLSASEAVMITCSSVPLAWARKFAASFGVPVIKVDGPMARRAVEIGPKVGVAVTFEGTVGPTSSLIRETAAELGREVDVQVAMAPGAYDALFRGDLETHDRLLLETIGKLAKAGVDSIVLAQVSMARVQPAAQQQVAVPVLSSFDTSLEALRGAIQEKAAV